MITDADWVLTSLRCPMIQYRLRRSTRVLQPPRQASGIQVLPGHLSGLILKRNSPMFSSVTGFIRHVTTTNFLICRSADRLLQAAYDCNNHNESADSQIANPVTFENRKSQIANKKKLPFAAFFVPRTRLELAHRNRHQPLKLACLPISPSGRSGSGLRAWGSEL